MSLSLVACHPEPKASPTVQGSPGPQVKASIQELMQSLVDPSADALWEAVATEVSAKGEVQHAPADDAEWLALRQHALRLIESANLLAMPGRAVAQAGVRLEDHEVPGISSPEQIEAAIAKDPAAFAAAAAKLQHTGLQALAAIDARDAQRLFAIGERIDQACEQCHSRYWYPGAKTPQWPAPIQTPAASVSR
ncbi:hypothetical protein [Paucibacter sp. Y2R2-4]|uniref:hypothetical protein n=1 Tax=Paucibacter sp. Y2R2-4 TaxID=2893553 RepID=UPI0021E49235|nr:hypothetical protein [Paucibacter sp. Y2R2-4]MCV2348299.1 hypothetical protein [Paucibacter sp. Y2R2-4]